MALVPIVRLSWDDTTIPVSVINKTPPPLQSPQLYPPSPTSNFALLTPSSARARAHPSFLPSHPSPNRPASSETPPPRREERSEAQRARGSLPRRPRLNERGYRLAGISAKGCVNAPNFWGAIQYTPENPPRTLETCLNYWFFSDFLNFSHNIFASISGGFSGPS